MILGHNRWAPSRMAAARGILDAVRREPGDTAQRLAGAHRRLSLLEASWWLHSRHLDRIRRHFRTVEVIGEVNDPLDGARVDLLLT